MNKIDIMVKGTLLGGVGTVLGAVLFAAYKANEYCDKEMYLQCECVSSIRKHFEKKQPVQFSVAEKKAIQCLFDNDLILKIYDFEGKGYSYGKAVDEAFYEIWREDDIKCEKGEMSDEEFVLRRAQSKKREEQYNSGEWRYMLNENENILSFADFIRMKQVEEYKSSSSVIKNNVSVPSYSSSEHTR